MLSAFSFGVVSQCCIIFFVPDGYGLELWSFNPIVSIYHSASHSASVNLRKMVGLLSERPIFKTEIEGVTELKMNSRFGFFIINKKGSLEYS